MNLTLNQIKKFKKVLMHLLFIYNYCNQCDDSFISNFTTVQAIIENCNITGVRIILLVKVCSYITENYNII